MEEKELDLQLVERAKAGDREAFKELVQKYQRRVFAICMGILKNPDDCHDVSQEVFLKVYRYLENFQQQSSFYTWLYRITVNMCIDHMRRNRRVQTVDYDDGVGREGNVEGDEWLMPSKLGFNPDQVFSRKELRQKMLEALETLSEKHRTILVLREVEGLSYEEMAEVLNISKGTVMSRLFHARRYFQIALEEYLGSQIKV